MLVSLLRSVGQAVIVMLTVAFIAFAMFTYVGDPVAGLAGQEATLADREALRERLGLNDPFVVQFGRFVANAVQGEFGISYLHQRPVAGLLRERLPATVELALVSSVFATALGIILGVFVAIRRESLLANLIMTVSLVGVSLPTFVIGIGLIYIFAVELRWLPSFGRGEVVAFGWWTSGLFTESGLKSIIMPALTLSFFQLTLIMRLVRAEMLDVMRTDYIRFARARGIPEHSVRFRHALRNTMIPVVTIVGLQLGQIIAFAIVTETVFQWPGLGALFVQAVGIPDIPVMSAYLLFVALVFVVINLVIDLLYLALDPRLRTARARA